MFCESDYVDNILSYWLIRSLVILSTWSHVFVWFKFQWLKIGWIFLKKSLEDQSHNQTNLLFMTSQNILLFCRTPRLSSVVLHERSQLTKSESLNRPKWTWKVFLPNNQSVALATTWAKHRHGPDHAKNITRSDISHVLFDIWKHLLFNEDHPHTLEKLPGWRRRQWKPKLYFVLNCPRQLSPPLLPSADNTTFLSDLLNLLLLFPTFYC